MAALLEKPGFLIVLVIILLLFGARRLPEFARGLGQSMRIFKSETQELRSGDDASAAAVTAQDAAPAPASAQPAAQQQAG